MRVSEVYGPVPQGEGLLLGTLMPFIRTAGCNLSCSWCDSAYTWEKGYTYTEMTPAEVVSAVAALSATDPRAKRCTWVSLTGGEPTLQHDAGMVVRLLGDAGFSVLVETNGLRLVPWFGAPHVFVSCSPKLPASGQDSPARRARVARLVAARNASPQTRTRTQYKFVIAAPEDLSALEAYCASVGIDLSGDPDTSPVYVQPDGYIQPTHRYLEALGWLQRSVPPGVRVTPQVHRLVHGPDARAV